MKRRTSAPVPDFNNEGLSEVELQQQIDNRHDAEFDEDGASLWINEDQRS